MIEKTKPAVGYIRMSTDKQEDSPARQRRDIESLAERSGYRIKAGAETKIKKAIEIAKRRDSTTQSKDERIMADRDDFQSISKLLCRWKDELAAIHERIDHPNRSLEPIPEALFVWRPPGRLVRCSL